MKIMKKSFTLIELIIVIGILGLLIGISIPAFTPFLGNIKLSAATKLAVSNLRLAQEKAMAQNTIYEIHFENNAYEIKGPSFNKIVKLPSGININKAKSIKFSASGNVLPGYSGTITLQEKNRIKKIVISSMGRIRVE